jgi:FdhE protein
LSLPPAYVAAKLARGVPALAREPIPLPVETLTSVLLRLCDELARGGAGDAAARIGAAVEQRRLDAGSLLGASMARDQAAIRTGALHQGLSADLLWLASELAVSPFAYVIQRTLLTPSSAATPLAAWREGYCPACGSWPALGEGVDDVRVLRCSFCALAWYTEGRECVYCAQATGVLEAPQGRSGTHLEVCAGCGGYLKIVAAAAPLPFPLVAISDLETMALDSAAAAGGYGRPPLKAFAHTSA